VTSRLRRSRDRPELALDEALAVSVESISKAYSGIHEARYRPAVSIFARLRERRSGGDGRVDPESVDEDEDSDDADDADDLLLEREVGAALVDVSFDVRRGEAVGVIGADEAASRTVARILCGMTSPTSGRVVVRGRIAPSIELATSLTRRETSARGVARRLAGLAGPRRTHRSQFVRAALDLAFGDSWAEADAARPPKAVLRRVAAAAAFDPSADVLVIDDLSDLGDADFPRRCRDRLAESLSNGVAVVVTAPDRALISDFCSRVVLLDEGRVARIGPGRELIAELTAQTPSEPEPTDPHAPVVRRKPALRSFNRYAALHSLALLRPDGSPLEDARPSDWIRVRIELETATQAPVMVVVRFVGAETITFVERRDLGEGAYVATLEVPPGTVPDGDYVIAAGLVLELEGERLKVGRRQAAHLRVGGDEEGLVLAAEAGVAPLSADETRATEARWSLDAVFE
jgi:ABC-type polysaccharide/polyol phosphate transport system ATPase subunit